MQKWLPKNNNLNLQPISCVLTIQHSAEINTILDENLYMLMMHKTTCLLHKTKRTCLDSTFERGKILAVLGTMCVTPCAKCSFFSATNMTVLFKLEKDTLETALSIMNFNLLQTSITLRKMKLESREVSLNLRKLRTPEKYPWTTPSNNLL